MDIARDLTNFVLEEKLGQEGGFGEVYLAKHLDSGQEIAIKIVQKARLSNWSIQSIKQERNFLVELHTYPWFSKLIFAKDGVNALYFGLKFYAGGDLFHLQLKYGGHLNEDIACFFIAEVLTAVNILHMLGILHRDLKRENILINADGHIVVGDFGISKYLKDNEVAITVVGSPGYIAPEVFTGNRYSYNANLFAVGVIFIEMITDHNPFLTVNDFQLPEIHLMNRYKLQVLHTQPNIKYCITKPALDFALSLLQKSPDTRSNFVDIKQMTFFKNILWSEITAQRYKAPFQFEPPKKHSTIW